MAPFSHRVTRHPLHVPVQSGRTGEPTLSGGFADHELTQRAYELSLQ
ncbi:hypothetical protein [Streptomyces antnestii]|nr:hypothetical protein [Streptomyces sp. San01]